MTTAASISATSVVVQPVILNTTAVSNAFVIPKNYQSVTFYTPLALALPTSPVSNYPGSVWKLQATTVYTGTNLDAWSDIYAFDASVGGLNTPTQLVFPFTASQALVLPAWYLGEGYCRISTFDTPQTADTTFTVVFSGFYK